MTVSATLAINEEIERRRAAGLPVLALGFGEAGLPVHESLVRRLSESAAEASYGPVAGIEELRSSAAGYWRRRNVPTTEGRVVAGPGSKPLLYAVLHAVGGPVALPMPSWVSYGAQAALVRTPIVWLPTLAGQGGVPDPAELAVAAANARRAGAPLTAVVVTLPDNPTGTLATPDTVRALCEIADRHDLLVISDEIYRDLLHDEQTPFRSPAELVPERTVVTTGLSKSLALGGWRIGVARLPDGHRGGRLMAQVLGVASEVWSAPAHPVQQVAAWAFTEPQVLQNRVELSRRLHGCVARTIADEFEAAGAHLARPQAGFYLYPDFAPLRRHLLESRKIDDSPGLARTLLDGVGIATLPGSAFGDAPAELRLRVATSQLYGATAEHREQALRHHEPSSLPWIAEQMEQLRSGLEWLIRDSKQQGPRMT